jgi:hypothetical protein
VYLLTAAWLSGQVPPMAPEPAPLGTVVTAAPEARPSGGLLQRIRNSFGGSRAAAPEAQPMPMTQPMPMAQPIPMTQPMPTAQAGQPQIIYVGQDGQPIANPGQAEEPHGFLSRLGHKIGNLFHRQPAEQPMMVGPQLNVPPMAMPQGAEPPLAQPQINTTQPGGPQQR